MSRGGEQPRSEPIELLGRDREIALLDGVLERASTQRGGAVALEGPAGIGKTELLRALATDADGRGLRIMVARGGELEREMAFGVVKQLFERVLVGASGAERRELLSGPAAAARPALGLESDNAGDGRTDPFGVIHGLFWLCANIAEAGPALLLVDDVHWADAESLRWLLYMQRRLEGLAVTLALAARPAEPAGDRALLDALLGEPALLRVQLGPLPLEAVSELIRAELGTSADAEFCRSCLGATGGNPWLLRELVMAVRADGIAPDAANAALAGELGAARLGRAMMVRLARLGVDTVAVAEAIAMLGAGAGLDAVAALAELDPRATAAAVDRLRAVGLLTAHGELDFTHPLVREAVYAELAVARRSLGHRQAARLLDVARAGDDRVAAQLLASEPMGDEWVVERLRVAAQAALLGGSPDAAVARLRRALAEPPSPELRAHVLAELGLAELPVDPSAATGHLGEALALAREPTLRATLASTLARALSFCDQVGEATAVLKRELVEHADGELRRLLEAELLMWGDFTVVGKARADWASQLQRSAGAIEGSGRVQSTILALWAYWQMQTEPAARAVEVLERVLTPSFSLAADPGLEVAVLVGVTLMSCGQPRRAHDLFEQGGAELRAAGQLNSLPFTYGYCALMQMRCGDLLDAEVNARTGLQLADELGPATPGWWWSMSLLVAVLTARGLLADAAEIVERRWPGGELPELMLYPLPLMVRGDLRAALGDHARAVEDLLAAAEWLEARGHICPAWASSHPALAAALVALERGDEARRLTEQTVTRARRFGAADTLGVALRAQAAAAVDEQEREALLVESVDALASSECRLEYARSLVELGSLTRRSNRRAAGRQHLAKGLDLALRCGDERLALHARDELAASGARPRRDFVTGPAALTASERRVARMAATGSTNREIAQALFVTPKTVEKHLANAYMKLGVAGRRELAATLGRD